VRHRRERARRVDQRHQHHGGVKGGRGRDVAADVSPLIQIPVGKQWSRLTSGCYTIG
jgi:hypothetical protein